MKGFGTFDTTNSLYGNFYSRKQDPITNVPRYSKPNMEEEFYNRTLEMQKGYFNRYAQKLLKKKMLKDHWLNHNLNFLQSNHNKKKIFQSKDHMYLVMKWKKDKWLMNLSLKLSEEILKQKINKKYIIIKFIFYN